jgi:hypothetical protein
MQYLTLTTGTGKTRPLLYHPLLKTHGMKTIFIQNADSKSLWNSTCNVTHPNDLSAPVKFIAAYMYNSFSKVFREHYGAAVTNWNEIWNACEKLLKTWVVRGD